MPSSSVTSPGLSPSLPAPPVRVREPGSGEVDIFPLPVDQDFLLPLLDDLFVNHWDKIVFGTLIQGAVFEIRVPAPPRRVRCHDGYLTVDFGLWHFHVCIGLNKGSSRAPTDPELARLRRTGRAELYRMISADGCPRSWGLRLFNGGGENQLTVFFPNPLLGDNDKILKQPDYSRLALWDAVRERYLGLPPDPLDRTATGFPCGG